MSLWADYIKELRGGATLFIEQPHGFVSYSFPEWGQNCIMLEDIYVTPEQRRSGLGTQLFNEVCEAGRKAGKKYIAAQLQLDTHIYVESLKAQLAVGLVPVAAENGKIFMRREL